MSTFNCKACGQELLGAVNSCWSCGTDIATAAPPAAKPQSSPGGQSPHASPNPYASPHAIAPDSPLAGGQRVLASKGQRFGNLIIDNVVTTVVSNGIGFLLGAAYGVSQAAAGGEMNEEAQLTLQLIGTAIGIATVIIYFIVAESLGQRSIGKLVTGTKVVNTAGGIPTFGQIVGRTFARFIPFEALSFLHDQPVGWHDSLSGTRVVKTR